MFRRGAGNGNSPLPTDPAPAFYPDMLGAISNIPDRAVKWGAAFESNHGPQVTGDP